MKKKPVTTVHLLRHSTPQGCATHFSLRLTLTAEAEGGKEGFIPMFGVDALGTGVLSRVGLKPDDPKENGAATGAMEEATGVGASGA